MRVIVTVLSLFVLSGLAHAEVCPFPAEAPATTRPFVKRGHEKRFADDLARIQQRLEAETFSVIALGDSIMHRWPSDMLQRATEATTLNAGIGGDTAPALLWRLGEGEDLRGLPRLDWSRQSPELVLMLVGTNDGNRNSACDVFHGIIAVADKVREVFPGANLVVFSILPRGDDMLERIDDIELTNSALKEAAPLDGFTFIDAHDAFLCDHRTPCSLVRPPSNVHPTEEGYQVLSGILQNELQRLGLYEPPTYQEESRMSDDQSTANRPEMSDQQREIQRLAKQRAQQEGLSWKDMSMDERKVMKRSVSAQLRKAGKANASQ